jgi:hypothetical protein
MKHGESQGLLILSVLPTRVAFNERHVYSQERHEPPRSERTTVRLGQRHADRYRQAISLLDTTSCGMFCRSTHGIVGGWWDDTPCCSTWSKLQSRLKNRSSEGEWIETVLYWRRTRQAFSPRDPQSAGKIAHETI